MTSKIESAARMALEALETDEQWGFVNKKVLERRIPAIIALREALDHSGESDEMVAEQAEQEQEPVAWKAGNVIELKKPQFANGWTPLYAAPLAKQDTHATHVVQQVDPCNPLQDLTDDEIDALIDSWMDTAEDYPEFARAVIAKDREKNK